MGLYGNRFSPEYFEEQLIQEMGFSKKDLQDPKTIEKIINSTNKYKSIYEAVDTMVLIIGSVITVLSLGLALPITAPLMDKTSSFVKAYPAKRNDKCIQKLKKKCLKLKDKYENKSIKDSKYKEIISNIEKTLKAIEDYENKIKNDKLISSVNAYRESIEQTFNIFLKGKSDPYDEYFNLTDDVSLLMSAYKISESKLIEIFSKFEPDYSIMDLGDDFSDEDIKKLSNYFSEFKDKDKWHEYIFKCIAYHDTYFVLFYKGKLYTLELFDNIVKQTQFNSFNEGYKITDDMIEADKLLGYYVLSDCPENVEKVSLPV